MTNHLDFESWSCPLPLRDHPNIILGHGGGGKLSAELIEHLFLPAFQNDLLGNLGDSTVLNLNGARLAMSTDSFVVRPLFFPGLWTAWRQRPRRPGSCWSPAIPKW
jgi:hydrogenase expression/formation protein HypE